MKQKFAFTYKLLAIMVGFGILIGVVFPFFVKFVLDLPASKVLTPSFFSMCIIAGLLVGGFNFYVFKSVFYDFLQSLSTKLTAFREKLSSVQREQAINCNEEDCLITLKTNDPIVGNITNSFNDFIKTIQGSMRAELITNRFLEDLKEGLSVKDIADVVLDAFVEYFGGIGGCIIGYEHGEFEVLKCKHTIVEIDALDKEELYKIMEKKSCVAYEKLSENPIKLNIVVGEAIPNCLAFIPLRYQDQKIGVAVLMAKTSFTRPLNSMESRNFVKHATPFLYNSSLIRRLEVLAAIDELTRVLNRRFGMKRLTEEFSRAQRFGSSFSICLIDIDNFKTINDTYGHQAGDEVLRSLSIQLQEDLRSADFIIRYGGEEFLVVLPGASLADSYSIMDRQRRRVETYKLQYGSYTINYTFSGGVCSFPSKNVDDPGDLIKFADEALYMAKKNGRNQIVMSEQK
jgi:diguanylate cyclase (GGDEF)-like protein